MPKATRPLECQSCRAVYVGRSSSIQGLPYEQLCTSCRTTKRERTCRDCEQTFVATGNTRRCLPCRKVRQLSCKRCTEPTQAGNRVYCIACESFIAQCNRHNISIEFYQEMLEKQNNVCAICQGQEPRNTNGRPWTLAVDHDHSCCPSATSCGKCVRGLLCSRCNAALGWFKDSADNLLSAVLYLESWKTSRMASETPEAAQVGLDPRVANSEGVIARGGQSHS